MGFRVLRVSIPVSTLLVSFALSAYGQARLSDYKNNLAPHVRSPQRAVDRMLEIAKLKPGETLYDLGCGEGQILIAAAERYKVKAVGIEISRDLADTAAEKVRKAKLQSQVTIVHGDFMQTDLSKADVVTLYLAPLANESLRPNLERYLRPHTRVVSYDYPIPEWKPIDTSESQGRSGAVHTIYLYEIPDSIVKK
ncbi:MAG: class I SAM-dependent methyltransferase [Acidobacteriaceae bacterium]|nr:class I SAM-dependent methyltransferase [Acidobacteriaceae bacterium]